jgi:hypothetical protein
MLVIKVKINLSLRLKFQNIFQNTVNYIMEKKEIKKIVFI